MKRLAHTRHRRGFTLSEMMIAVAISSMVMVAVASMQYLCARAHKELYGVSNTRSSRAQSIAAIRFRLCNARVGSVVGFSLTADGESYHEIRFVDPNLGGVTSAFRYDDGNRILYYFHDVSDSSNMRVLVRGPIDISFAPQPGGTLVLIKVKTLSDMVHADVDVQDGETMVYLRNI